MVSIKVRFVDALPAPAKPGRKPNKTSKYARVAKALRENPGQWALIANIQNRRSSSSIRKALRRFGVQIAVRTSGGGWYRVYARYNPTSE